MAVFDIDFREMHSLINKLEKMSAVGSVASWTGVEDAIIADIKRVFAAEGPGWAKRAESTKISRVADGFSADGPLLVQEGDLLKGMTDGAVFKKGPRTLSYSPDSAIADIAAAHQTGTKKIPKRAAINKKTMEKAIIKAFSESFSKRITEAWDTGIRTF